MITIISDKINSLNQNSYDLLINSININQLKCSCGHSGTLTRHACYSRSIKLSGGIQAVLNIVRVKCSHCGKTHALIPAQIVSYSQFLLNDHISICSNYIDNISQEKIMTDNPLIDESNISYIIRNFNKHWVQRLAAFSISLGLNTTELVKKCFSLCSRQFMQIKCTVNILYLCTHTT